MFNVCTLRWIFVKMCFGTSLYYGCPLNAIIKSIQNQIRTVGPHVLRCYGVSWVTTVYPKKCAHGFCFAVLCWGYTLTEFPISIRLTSLALWQSNDCPSASKATLMNMYKYFMWIHYERLHNHNKAKHNKTVCIFLGIYCTYGESVIWSFDNFFILSLKDLLNKQKVGGANEWVCGIVSEWVI